MTRRAPHPQTPRHVPIFDEDWEWLEKAYGPASPGKVGVGPTIRHLVHVFVKAQKAKEEMLVEQKLATQPQPGGAKA